MVGLSDGVLYNGSSPLSTATKYLGHGRQLEDMSVSGLCQVCEAAEARFSCSRCGRLVCEDHFDRESGFCLECARESGLGGPDESPPDFLR